MSTAAKLVRPEIAALKAYVAASYEDGMLRLNANETPWPPAGTSPSVSLDTLNQYPEERPVRLTNRLAEYYGVDPENLLVTRGSSEGIDLLIRCFCSAGDDDIVISPPTFGMYRVYADVQGAGIKQVPLITDNDFALDVDGILGAWDDRCKLLFVCSPNNPSGTPVAKEDLERLCEELDGKGLVVVDAAYTEFGDYDPTELVSRFENAVVLRTLSKALGLAGVRCGSLIASVEIIGYLQRILPPYSYPTPCQNAVLAALDEANRDVQQERINTLVSERERLAAAFNDLNCFTKVWPSDANFLLVRAIAPDAVRDAATAAGVLIREFKGDPDTAGCFRITIGSPEQNDTLLAAFGAL